MTTPIAQGPVDVNVSRHCTCHPDDNPPTPCEHCYAFRDCADAAEERYLREMLAMLQESYAKAAKPYIDRLVEIHSMLPPAPMIVTLEQAQALGLMTANVELRGAEPIGEASLSNAGFGVSAGPEKGR